MSRLARRYVKEVYNNLHHWPAWFPNSRVEIGQVGVIRSRVFEPETALGELGVTFSTAKGTPADITYGTANSYRITAKAAGTANPQLPSIPDGSFGVGVSFTRDWSIVKALGSVVPEHIVDMGSVSAQVQEILSWNPKWVLVTSVCTARTGTVLISTSRGSSIEVGADIQVDAAVAALARAEANLHVMATSNISYELVGAASITPLFGVRMRRDVRAGWTRRGMWPQGLEIFGEVTPEGADELEDL